MEVFGNSSGMIVAGTGFVGHHQRFVDSVKTANARGDFRTLKDLDVGRRLSELGVSDFASTGATSGSYSALVAFASQGKPSLCELDGSANFQPELKAAEDLWFASNGSGMLITDPILALFRNVFWHDAAPDVTGGVFTAYWALHHACEVNPGGINHPIRIATLRVTDQKVVAAMYTDDQLQETSDLVSAAIDHVRGFKDVLLGNLKVGSAPPSLK